MTTLFFCVQQRLLASHDLKKEPLKRKIALQFPFLCVPAVIQFVFAFHFHYFAYSTALVSRITVTFI